MIKNRKFETKIRSGKFELSRARVHCTKPQLQNFFLTFLRCRSLTAQAQHDKLAHNTCYLSPSVFNNVKPPLVPAQSEGTMNELIDRLVANVGIDKPTAEKAVGIILGFLKKEAPPDRVQALIDSLPGAAALVEAQQGGGGMFDMGGVMGVGTKLMGAGLSMSQVQSVTKEIIAYTREKAGDEAIGEIVAAIPGLSQFV
jgi:hypothetical protein